LALKSHLKNETCDTVHPFHLLQLWYDMVMGLVNIK